ncbi:AAEL009319-PA [Aedes aegypti]|uniref:AAEL009319-PA n=1 Tax=Aedes aegypti TaxID=7159 RepID=Q16W70_AEDAE|nr:AAEL009319-PA [Aedes aegypti]
MECGVVDRTGGLHSPGDVRAAVDRSGREVRRGMLPNQCAGYQAHQENGAQPVRRWSECIGAGDR